jgi:hypothetical protein
LFLIVSMFSNARMVVCQLNTGVCFCQILLDL